MNIRTIFAIIIFLFIPSVLSAQNDGGFYVQGLSPYTGVTVGSMGGQLVLGAKVNLGKLPVVPVNIVPEFASTMGKKDASLLMNLSLEAHIVKIHIGTNSNIVPMIRVGEGILWTQSTDKLWTGLNLAYGITLESVANPTGTKLFIEHQGIDAFKENRIIVGLTLGN